MRKDLPVARIVLVAVDASPASLAALDSGARMASHLKAELRGVFVEDIDIVRTAALPFAVAIASSGQTHPLTPGAIELQLRRQAEIARGAVEAAGARSNVACSFAVVRGTVRREIARAAAGAAVVTVGWSGKTTFGGDRLGSLARYLLETGTTSLLVVRETGTHESIDVVYDGSPSSNRALEFAAALDGGGAHMIGVWIPEELGEDRGGVIRRLEDLGLRPRFETLKGDLPSAFAACLRKSDTRTILIPASLSKLAQQVAALGGMKRSVFLVC